MGLAGLMSRRASITQEDIDRRWMREAIQLAHTAKDHGLLPFGAVVARRDRALGRGMGSTFLLHSEMWALREARRWNLSELTLYSTAELCHMCAGASLHYRIGRIVWGAARSDRPDLFRPYEIPTTDVLADSSHAPQVVIGVLRSECVELWKGLVPPLQCDLLGDQKQCSNCLELLPTRAFPAQGAQCVVCLREKNARRNSQQQEHSRYREARRQSSAKWRLKIKQDIMDHYGQGRCACCGEDRLIFLTIDHPKGDGGKERRETGLSGGQRFWLWLKRRGYPPGYRVLCWNCQMAWAWTGTCPHQVVNSVVIKEI